MLYLVVVNGFQPILTSPSHSGLICLILLQHRDSPFDPYSLANMSFEDIDTRDISFLTETARKVCPFSWSLDLVQSREFT